MSKIVISGGTGLIGRPLTKRLVDAGHELVLLSRNPGKYQDQFPAGVRFVSWDAVTMGDWIKEVDGADAVINLAAESIGGDNFLPDRWTEEKRKRITKSRINTSHAIVEAIQRAEIKPEVLLQASAIGYYGPHDDEWVTEQSPAGKDFLASVALDWENASLEVEEMGVRRIVLRTGLVLTTEGGPLARMIVPFKFFVGGPYGNGSQWYSWIHLQDLVEAICFLRDDGSIGGPVNLVSPNPVRNKEFAKILGKVMNRPSLIPVPSFAMKILAGDAAMLVLDGQRVSSAYLQEQGFQFQFADLEYALTDLINSA